MAIAGQGIATNISLNTTWVSEAFNNTHIFGVEYLISIAIILITLVVITRQIEKWKSLALPVTTLWYIMGIEVHILMFLIATILFAIDTISLQILGEALKVGEGISETIKKATRKDEDIQYEREKAFWEKQKEIQSRKKIFMPEKTPTLYEQDKAFWRRQAEIQRRKPLIKRIMGSALERKQSNEDVFIGEGIKGYVGRLKPEKTEKTKRWLSLKELRKRDKIWR